MKVIPETSLLRIQIIIMHLYCYIKSFKVHAHIVIEAANKEYNKLTDFLSGGILS